jgi:hypothetical protein
LYIQRNGLFFTYTQDLRTQKQTNSKQIISVRNIRSFYRFSMCFKGHFKPLVRQHLQTLDLPILGVRSGWPVLFCVTIYKESWCFNSETLIRLIHAYHSRLIPKGVAEASQIFLQDAHVLPKWLRYEVSPSSSDCYLSQVGVLLILYSAFMTFMEEREKCYSFVLSLTPLKTNDMSCEKWLINVEIFLLSELLSYY